MLIVPHRLPPCFLHPDNSSYGTMCQSKQNAYQRPLPVHPIQLALRQDPPRHKDRLPQNAHARQRRRQGAPAGAGALRRVVCVVRAGAPAPPAPTAGGAGLGGCAVSSVRAEAALPPRRPAGQTQKISRPGGARTAAAPPCQPAGMPGTRAGGSRRMLMQLRLLLAGAACGQVAWARSPWPRRLAAARVDRPGNPRGGRLGCRESREAREAILQAAAAVGCCSPQPTPCLLPGPGGRGPRIARNQGWMRSREERAADRRMDRRTEKKDRKYRQKDRRSVRDRQSRQTRQTDGWTDRQTDGRSGKTGRQEIQTERQTER
jgi:hypothetical protein